MKRTFVAVAVMVTAALGGGFASAAWLSPSGTGSAQATATSVGAGNAPSANASGSSVTVTWSASTLATGYTVKRYNAIDVAQTIGSGCSGTIAALTCTETGLSAGTWKYSVTPVHANWTGAESTKTAVVVVADTTAPAATITFAANNGTYNGTSFNAGCNPNPSNVCGTASDATAVVTVKVSIRQGNNGNYWNGSSFGSATESFTNATLTSPNGTSTDWRLPVSLTADASYTIRVRTVDLAGNTQTTGYAATSTFTYDNTAASLTNAVLSKAGSKVNVGGSSDLAKDTDISVVVCKSSSFPCSAADTAVTWTIKVGNNGNWSTGNSDNLANGTYWARATHTDAAGNTGTSNVTNSVTIS